jgi:hypothetical protein
MRPYTKLTNGAWKDKRCNDFNVRASKVDIPRGVATRITTVLKRMPKDKTLGDLVTEGHRTWVEKYEDMGKACQEYLMAAINAVAGEQVIMKKVTAKPRVEGIARKADEDKLVIAPSKTTRVMPSAIAEKLAEKFKVSQKDAPVYTAHSSLKDVPIDPDHMFDDLNEVQLRNKCVTQMKQLWKLNKDNAALRREIAEIKDQDARPS